jgi:hypothetical protein
MPGSQTTPGQTGACNNAPARVAFRQKNAVGTRDETFFEAQWLACMIPYRRFADALTDACARLGADVDRYSFIVMDLHHLLLAGLPAHSCSVPLCVPEGLLVSSGLVRLKPRQSYDPNGLGLR